MADYSYSSAAMRRKRQGSSRSNAAGTEDGSDNRAADSRSPAHQEASASSENRPDRQNEGVNEEQGSRPGTVQRYVNNLNRNRWPPAMVSSSDSSTEGKGKKGANGRSRGDSRDTPGTSQGLSGMRPSSGRSQAPTPDNPLSSDDSEDDSDSESGGRMSGNMNRFRQKYMKDEKKTGSHFSSDDSLSSGDDDDSDNSEAYNKRIDRYRQKYMNGEKEKKTKAKVTRGRSSSQRDPKQEESSTEVVPDKRTMINTRKNTPPEGNSRSSTPGRASRSPSPGTFQYNKYRQSISEGRESSDTWMLPKTKLGAPPPLEYNYRYADSAPPPPKEPRKPKAPTPDTKPKYGKVRLKSDKIGRTDLGILESMLGGSDSETADDDKSRGVFSRGVFSASSSDTDGVPFIDPETASEDNGLLSYENSDELEKMSVLTTDFSINDETQKRDSSRKSLTPISDSKGRKGDISRDDQGYDSASSEESKSNDSRPPSLRFAALEHQRKESKSKSSQNRSSSQALKQSARPKVEAPTDGRSSTPLRSNQRRRPGGDMSELKTKADIESSFNESDSSSKSSRTPKSIRSDEWKERAKKTAAALKETSPDKRRKSKSGSQDDGSGSSHSTAAKSNRTQSTTSFPAKKEKVEEESLGNYLKTDKAAEEPSSNHDADDFSDVWGESITGESQARRRTGRDGDSSRVSETSSVSKLSTSQSISSLPPTAKRSISSGSPRGAYLPPPMPSSDSDTSDSDGSLDFDKLTGLEQHTMGAPPKQPSNKSMSSRSMSSGDRRPASGKSMSSAETRSTFGKSIGSAENRSTSSKSSAETRSTPSKSMPSAETRSTPSKSKPSAETRSTPSKSKPSAETRSTPSKSKPSAEPQSTPTKSMPIAETRATSGKSIASADTQPTKVQKSRVVDDSSSSSSSEGSLNALDFGARPTLPPNRKKQEAAQDDDSMSGYSLSASNDLGGLENDARFNKPEYKPNRAQDDDEMNESSLNEAFRDLHTDEFADPEAQKDADSKSSSTVESARPKRRGPPPKKSPFATGYIRHLTTAWFLLIPCAGIGALIYVFALSNNRSAELPKGSLELFVTVPTLAPTVAPVALPTNPPAPVSRFTLSPTISPSTESPTAQPTVSKITELRTFLIERRPSLEAEFIGFRTSQYFALDWLANNADLDIYSEDRLLQRFALATLYFSTAGDRWRRNSLWLSDEDECLWYSGVSLDEPCDEDGSYINLELDLNNLQGTILSELVLLSNLKKLDFSRAGSAAALIGTVPRKLGELVNLETVNLSGNSLVGTIPREIGNWINVSDLNLSSNRLSGRLPTQVGSMRELSSLRIESNSLVGPFPTTIGFLTKLRRLIVSDNRFEGPIPPALGGNFLLEVANFDNNQFTLLPSEVGQLIFLRQFSASSNQLGGTIPPQYGNLVNLLTLRLANNEVSCPCCLFCCDDAGGCACQFLGTELEFLCAEFNRASGLTQRLGG